VSTPRVAVKSAESWIQQALGHRARGEREQALRCLGQALEIRHNDVQALLQQAEVELELEQVESAVDSLHLALAFAPDCTAALLALAKVANHAGEPLQALPYLAQAVQLEPDSAEAWFELGRANSRCDKVLSALCCYARVLDLQPRHAGACVNLGLLYLAHLASARRAQHMFERAIQIDPGLVSAQANLGLALHEQGHFELALAHYQGLIDAHPDIIEYRWNRGLALLSQGDFAHGWPDYEWRNARGGRSGARHFPFPAWNGASLRDRYILVYGEQGVGDEIMFASCIPEVIEQARSTVVECDVRLAGLFQRSFPLARVHGARRDGDRSWLNGFPTLDTQVACGSLPGYMRRQWSDFPNHQGYLVPDPARLASCKSRLAALGMDLKVGLCLRGGTLATRRHARSIRTEACLDLLRTPSCHFVCLQNGDCADEVEKLGARGIRLHWWPHINEDFETLAALIASLDVVISVPCSSAHLAGALGKPLWLLLSASPEWRYLARGSRMPWYPSATSFRQQRAGDWSGVVMQVQEALMVASLRGQVVPSPTGTS
jgi:cytochrome c-type biogenesis protein CcmH/NrfG